MPRYRRQIAPGSVQHVISRFVNREFRFDREGARGEYLRRAGLVLGRTDWRALAFALMSSHVHWAMRAGAQPSATVIKPLHVGFATWLNAAERSLGPVFADRHRSLTFEGETAAALITYVHNNPVRARVVSDPADSSWTSHRAYLGIEPAPPWLDVELGLHLCGFSATRSGRLAFHDMVIARMGEPRRRILSAEDMPAQRSLARHDACGPIEIATPTVTQEHGALQLEVPIVRPQDCTVHPRWNGEPERVLQAVALHSAVAVAEMKSRSRVREVASARRLALLAWTRELQRPAIDMARLLGISSSSAAELITTASPAARHTAAELAKRIRDPLGAG